MIHYRAIWGKKFCIHPIPMGTTSGRLTCLGQEFILLLSQDSNGDCLRLESWPGEPSEYDFDAVLVFEPSKMFGAVRVLRPADAR